MKMIRFIWVTASLFTLTFSRYLCGRQPFKEEDQQRVAVLALDVGQLRLGVEDRLALVELHSRQALDGAAARLLLEHVGGAVDRVGPRLDERLVLLSRGVRRVAVDARGVGCEA